MAVIIVIAASAGGFQPLRRLVSRLPIPCAASVFVVMHIGNHQSILPELLDRPSLPAGFAHDRERIVSERLYVAPADHHLIIEAPVIRLSLGPKMHHARPAADPTFCSAAECYGSKVVGVVLSGGDGDGAEGLVAVEKAGGLALVQNPLEADVDEMPNQALLALGRSALFGADDIGNILAKICRQEVASLDNYDPHFR